MAWDLLFHANQLRAGVRQSTVESSCPSPPDNPMRNTRQTFADLCKRDLYHGTVPRYQTRDISLVASRYWSLFTVWRILTVYSVSFSILNGHWFSEWEIDMKIVAPLSCMSARIRWTSEVPFRRSLKKTAPISAMLNGGDLRRYWDKGYPISRYFLPLSIQTRISNRQKLVVVCPKSS